VIQIGTGNFGLLNGSIGAEFGSWDQKRHPDGVAVGLTKKLPIASNSKKNLKILEPENLKDGFLRIPQSGIGDGKQLTKNDPNSGICKMVWRGNIDGI
jgi:hypothetical protein